MIDILWNFASFIIALGILVAVHEFGHFWVARKCGVKVEKFSIGFGKALWTKRGADGTEYSVSVIPLGGYVKMLDGRVDDVPPAMQKQAFDKKPLWQRTAIVSAGPVFNFLFAIIVYWLIFLIGISTVKPIVGDVTPNSIAAQAGIESGMELTSVSGIKTTDWGAVSMRIASHIGDEQMTVTVISPGDSGVEETKILDISAWSFDPEEDSVIMNSLGFMPYRPGALTTVSLVSDGSAAEQAGFKAGDKIVSIDGEVIQNWEQVVETISLSPGIEMTVSVERDGSLIRLVLNPATRELDGGRVIGFAGLAPEFEEWPQQYRINLQYGVIDSVGKSIDKTGQVIALTFSMLKKLIVGDVGIDNLSGPISIAKGAGATAEYGLVHFLGFLALISINLGIINLMPLPVLDGGHLLFYAIEAIIRRPVPEKVQEIGFRIGGVIIFSLMTIAVFNDFMRL